DEYLIDPAPYSDAAAWCRDRLVTTTRRLAELDPTEPTVLVNHWPLLREPTKVLRHPDLALWCGPDPTADWHRRYPAQAWRSRRYTPSRPSRSTAPWTVGVTTSRPPAPAHGRR